MLTDAQVNHYLAQMRICLEKQYENDVSETVQGLLESLLIAESHFRGSVDGGIRYRSVFCPGNDMMPYEHLEIVGDLEEKAYHAGNNDDHDTARMTMSHDEIIVIRLALTMYKSVLMQVHKQRIKEELANTIKAFAEGLKKEDDDEQA